MIPNPVHPAVVHLPIALAVLLPGLALLTLVAVARGLLPARAWLLVVLLQAVLVGSAWLALETGEEQEERVERVVAERYIEGHEEAAERFLVLAVAVLALTATGLLRGRLGEAGRAVATAATLAVLVGGFLVGRSGGELVYEHGAASAYVPSDALRGSAPAVWREAHEDDDD